MSVIRTITDGVSTIRFYDQHGTPNAKDFFSFVTWTYEPIPGLIRQNDFCPEPINNIAQGVRGGKFPLKADLSKIIGYTAQADAGCYSGDQGEPNFCGGEVRDCALVQADPPAVQFWYTTVNEFVNSMQCGELNPHPGTGIDISNQYALDGRGNLTVHHFLMSQVQIEPVVQNLHFVELGGVSSLWDLVYEVHYETQFGPVVQQWSPDQFFGSAGLDPQRDETLFTCDVDPKSGYPVNTPFSDAFCAGGGRAWYYTWTARRPKVLGVSRKADGAGVLMVWGQLPPGSQPTINTVYGGSEGMIPLITQLAMSGYQPNTTTHWKLHLLPMDGRNNAEQRTLALELANYTNPISIRPTVT